MKEEVNFTFRKQQFSLSYTLSTEGQKKYLCPSSQLHYRKDFFILTI